MKGRQYRSAKMSASKVWQNQGDDQDLWILLWAFDYGRGLATPAVLEQEYGKLDLSKRLDDVAVQAAKELMR